MIYILLSTAKQLKLPFLFSPLNPPAAATSLHGVDKGPGFTWCPALCSLTPNPALRRAPHPTFLLLLPILISTAPCPPALPRQSPVRALSLTCARLSMQTLIKERPLKAQQMLKIKGLFKWFPVEALGEIRKKTESCCRNDTERRVKAEKKEASLFLCLCSVASNLLILFHLFN